jgi:Dyp-type peroxidase family
MTETTSARLAVAPGDIQQNIVRSARPQVAAYAFFSITSPQRFREFIASRGAGTAAQSPGTVQGATLIDVLMAPDVRILPERGSGRPQAGFTVAFTWTGLRALGVNPVTLETFPAAFKEGMAARAHLLGDSHESAPERWDGWLGHRDVHGMIGILVGASRSAPAEQGVPSLYTATVALARELAQSDGEPPAKIAALERSAGFRIVHLEVGYTPLKQHQGESYRVEHFGFRDGLSQPFVDLGLTPPPPGGGTPRRDGTWAPVAPGEIFLGPPDEDNLRAIQPANAELRTSGTYMVFRKLAQDVVGFHDYVAERARDKEHEQLLAAQMFGRWQNGAPLTRHPQRPKWYGTNERHLINDFRFHNEDPHGLKCPVASHVRRVNPRDQQLRDVSKRHRILRQSIPYGGPIVERTEDWDGIERGLLFICFQSRIDAQFEFIQREWINGADIFGQAGLDKCPITGANNGALTDAFQVPGSAAALTHIPRFVTTRGGDYFFVPGMAALNGIAEGRTFDPQYEHGFVAASKPVDGAVTMGLDDAITRTSIDFNRPHLTPNPSVPETPSLFSERRLAMLGQQLLQSEARVVRYRFSERRDRQADATPSYAAFIGRYDDVCDVLSNEAAFGVGHYREHIEEITHGKSMVMGLAADDPVRRERLQLLLAAIGSLTEGGKRDLFAEMEAAAGEIIKTILARLLPSGRLDVVRDLGLVVPVMIAKFFYGLPGPERISPTAIAASFARLELTDVPPDWLARMEGVFEHEKPVVTVQAWAQATFREVFLNIVRARELTISSQRMTDEMLLHIDQLMEEEYRRPSGQRHLLAALMNVKRSQGGNPAAIDEHIRALLAELLVGGIYTVGKAFANIVDLILDPGRIEPRMTGIVAEGGQHRADLMSVLREICATADPAVRRRRLDGFIGECLRFRPVSPVLFRICTADASIGGQRIAKGDLVCTLVQAAGMDPRKFSSPREFRLDREPGTYLHFGPTGGPHRCLGEQIALAELRSLLTAIQRLKDFRRAAGPRGDLEELLRLPQALTVRFLPEAHG